MCMLLHVYHYGMRVGWGSPSFVLHYYIGPKGHDPSHHSDSPELRSGHLGVWCPNTHHMTSEAVLHCANL